MGKKQNRSLALIIIILTALLWVATILSANYNSIIFVIELLVTAVMTVVSAMKIYTFKKAVRGYITSAANQLESLGTDSMAKFQIPILVTNFSGEITWYNDAFFEKVLCGDEIYGLNINTVFEQKISDMLLDGDTLTLEYNDRVYKVNSFKSKHRVGGMMLYLFYDNTAYRKINDLYEQSKTSVMFIQIDGMDFMLKNTLESQKSEILGSIDREIETALSDKSSYIQKIATDKYIVFMQKEMVDKLKENKFAVLKFVRSLQFGEKGGLTLSIGVGLGSDYLSECVELANSALDMAVSRGGDQAVLKSGDEYEFFGGIKQAAQINSRVRTRVVAGTLKKMIAGCENVLIMGHSFSDMDSVGAAVALCKTVRELKKPAQVVLNPEKTLAQTLVAYVKNSENYHDYFITPDDSLKKVGKGTLVIIVDTHRRATVESPELFDKAQTTVIIDHHRKATDCIDNALLFYHDASASSACEMVTELIEYIGTSIVGKVEAEALLAGIMLDTHNFVLRTSARTFEASAFLRASGAEPVDVSRFFADSMETYKSRADIVSRAQIYGDCAISYANGGAAETRMAAAQAADELLTIAGVGASFVMYGDEQKVNISARSYGALNVQLVMEELGGGGHQTMAAAQIKDVTFEDAAKQLIDAITTVKDSI